MRSFSKREKLALAVQFGAWYQDVKRFHQLSQANVQDYQFRAVRRLLRIAYFQTDFYRHKYDEAGIHPEDIRSWQDFKQLPTLTKDELIQGGLQALDRRVTVDKLLVSRSSGSTGQFVSVYLSPRALTIQAAQAVRMIAEMDPKYGPLDREVLMYTSDYPYSSIGGLYRMVCVNNLLPVDQMVAALLKVRPAVVAAYPSILREILHHCESKPPLPEIRTIITNSEHSSQEERDHYARQFNCAVYDEFSSEELSSIAYQCRHRRYHLTQDSSYVELLSPDSDTDVGAGRLGEIVGTSLINDVMPIIRYRQEDLATWGEGRCSCGRNAPTLRTLAGRKNSSFRRQDGTVIPSGRILDWTYSLILRHDLDIREFQLVQQSSLNIEIQLVIGRGGRASGDMEFIAREFKRTFGESFDVATKTVPVIIKALSGKHVPIRSLI